MIFILPAHLRCRRDNHLVLTTTLSLFPPFCPTVSVFSSSLPFFSLNAQRAVEAIKPSDSGTSSPLCPSTPVSDTRTTSSARPGLRMATPSYLPTGDWMLYKCYLYVCYFFTFQCWPKVSKVARHVTIIVTYPVAVII